MEAYKDVDKARAMQKGKKWFLRHLHDGHRPQWNNSNYRIDSFKFTAETKTWLSIICSYVIPLKNKTDMSLDKAMIIYVFMEGLEVNIGGLILQQIFEVVIEG